MPPGRCTRSPSPRRACSPSPPADSSACRAHPELVASLRKQYEDWFRDVSSTRGYAPPRIFVGTEAENPVILTRQDWRGPDVSWKPDSPPGHWLVDVRRGGRYAVTLRIYPAPAAGQAEFRLNGYSGKTAVAEGATECRFDEISLPVGAGKVEAWVAAAGQRLGVRYVDLRRL